MKNTFFSERSFDYITKNKNISIKDLIDKQCFMRFNNEPNIGLKINLYRDYEVAALADAIYSQKDHEKYPIESIMVGDSYFSTHLGKNSTRLITYEEKQWGLDVMNSLIYEVNNSIESHFSKEERPYLIGDMPDGAIDNIESAFKAARSMVSAGADVIKMEISSKESLEILNELSKNRFNVMAHIGYTPQSSNVKRYGNSLIDALKTFALCRKLRDYGACSVVLEMMNEVVNQSLCKGRKDNMLQIYSIFSGQAKYGGQSLNIWDSVFLSSSEKKRRTMS